MAADHRSVPRRAGRPGRVAGAGRTRDHVRTGLGVGRGMTAAASPEPFALTLSAAQQMIRGGDLSPVELTRSCIDRISSLDDRVHAFVDFRPEEALAQARAAETEVRSGRHHPLLGVPFAIKDQFDVAGAASFMTPAGVDRDATVVSRLRAAGAVFLGKLAMTGYPDVPAPRNPWNLSRTTGGSSSGPAGAGAARFCPVAIGEDSAGSARNPAAFCGLVGLVGTYGRVSRWGMASMRWTRLAVPGPPPTCGPRAVPTSRAWSSACRLR